MTEFLAEIVGTPDVLIGQHIVGRVSLDATRSPHVTADISVTLDPDTLDLLDPRDSPRIRLTAIPENFAQGSDFEEDSTMPWSIGPGWSVDTYRAHNGSRSFNIDAADGSGSCYLQNIIEVSEGDEFYVECWAYRQSSWDGTGKSKIRFADGSGSPIYGLDYGATSLPAWTWVKLSGSFTIPAGVTRLTASLRSDATAGELWLDEIVIGRARRFDLGIRARPVRQRDASVQLSLASDEALLADYAPLADDDTPLTLVDSLRDVVDYVLDKALGTTLDASPSIDYDFTGTGYDDDAFTWRAGQSGIDFLQPLVQAAGFRLVCDENRDWTLRDENYVVAPAISIRYGVNLNDGTDIIDRDAGLWCDACVVRYTWNNAAGDTLEEVDSYALSTPYTRLRLIERDTPYPGDGFAAYVVRRSQFRGREVEATSAADWAAKAEQYVSIVLDGAPTQTGVVEKIEYDIAGDRMTVRSRTVDTPAGAIDLLAGYIDGLAGYIDGL